MIKIVVSRIQNCDYKVDRSSVLGNPFKMFKEEERDLVCDKFYQYFESKIQNNDSAFIDELKKIKDLAYGKQFFKIGCHCSPSRCHADTIAYFLNNYSESL